MLEHLERERDALIYQLQQALDMENDTQVAYLIGKLSQIQELIISLKDGSFE
jgi:hypothetical protein